MDGDSDYGCADFSARRALYRYVVAPDDISSCGDTPKDGVAHGLGAYGEYAHWTDYGYCVRRLWTLHCHHCSIGYHASMDTLSNNKA